MQNNQKCWLATLVVVLANVVLWSIPSDLAYNVAQCRDILLGRYTVDKFTSLLIVSVVSLLVIRGIWVGRRGKTNRQIKESWFRLIALSISIFISVVAADVIVRIAGTRQYIGTAASFHRLPNTVNRGIMKDVPATAFSYPKVPAGYPDFEYTLTVDKNGFRNKTNLETCDVVTLGDSFTEGSHVSDEHAWPVVFAQKSGLAVYNLGTSGGNPVTYLDTLKKFGLILHPKLVICMLYEGNDFRSSNFAAEKVRQSQGVQRWNLHSFYKSSPLRLAMKNFFIRCFGPISCRRFAADNITPAHPLYAVSWLPVAIPQGQLAKYYAFDIKSLLDHYRLVDRRNFLDSKGCRETFDRLCEIKKVCDENKIRFIVAYASDKPHVLPPLIRDNLSAEKLHAFMALKEKNLPPADALIDILLARLDIQESAVEQFCRQQSIEFVSLTLPMRQSIAEGSQAYFTFDQHLTPIGQEIVAEVLYNYIKSSAGKTN